MATKELEGAVMKSGFDRAPASLRNQGTSPATFTSLGSATNGYSDAVSILGLVNLLSMQLVHSAAWAGLYFLYFRKVPILKLYS